MPRSPVVVAVGLGASLAAGAVHLAVGDVPHPQDAVLLLTAGMALLTVIAVAGLLLARGRWTRPVCGGLLVAWIAVSASSPVSPASAATVAVAAVTLTVTAGPWLSSWVRHLPSATGPPPAAAVALLALAATPAAIGLASTSGVAPATWAVAAWAPMLALGVGRAIPGALAALRIGHPAIVTAAAFAAGPPSALGIVAAGVLAAASGWHRDLSVAFTRRVPAGHAYAIPPELAPPEVLEAAGLDDRGRATDSR